ncbi:hypothetical protein [Halobacillus sp. Marseille-P3879]|nr:hypothetical protein [Halobacillus sp. Marseille-P3879]
MNDLKNLAQTHRTCLLTLGTAFWLTLEQSPDMERKNSSKVQLE